eukprot:TRINITY_DN7340_c0_g1_i1.p1 TRINITY_DN7340_c0_g1~~TRINITY_DN7340_c0_g1_i1.p1  ORF type:complete len:319 (+),score=77.79 TRINITY_DN7340_c0_g1_i1:67-957(+)
MSSTTVPTTPLPQSSENGPDCEMDVIVDVGDQKKPGGKSEAARDAFKNKDVAASRKAHENKEDHGGTGSEYVKSIVFGGLDGIITTFAVVAAAQGAGDENLDVAKTVLILGFANLFADGFSMGFGEFLSSRAELDFAKSEREREEWEFKNSPDLEKKEMIDLYQERGISEEDAETLVSILSKDKDLFIDTMMVEELGIQVELEDQWAPFKSAVAMFVSFICFGMVPLFVYLPQKDGINVFIIACSATAVTLFVLGAVRGKLTRQHWLKCGLYMVLNGAIAAGISYLVGFLVGEAVD